MPQSKLPSDLQGAGAAGWVNRFGPGRGTLALVLLDDKMHPSIHEGRSLWALSSTLTYIPAGQTDPITLPRGFQTDLASIPRWGWIVLPPDGPWVKAAVVHDYLYATRGTGVWWSNPANPEGIGRQRPYSRAESDHVLLEAMENRGVGWFKRWVIYLAVRIGGWLPWSKPRRTPVGTEEDI